MANLLDDNRAARRLMLALGGQVLEERRQPGMRELVLALPS